jgi:Protein of unknown function (DUF2809)
MQRVRYIIVALVSLALGLLILGAGPGFIRSYLGDVVVVVFIYALVKSTIDIHPMKLAIAIFAFAVVPELLQYFNTADRLELTGAARIAVGTLFDPYDFLAYAAGVIIIYLLDICLLAQRPEKITG